MKQILIAATLAFGLNATVAAEDLDQLLAKIEADISAQRLTKPAGNNALERIDAFRKQAPFDYRITPLVFKFGESYVALANKSINNRRYPQAQGYLDIAWQVSPLAPGLEAAQEKLDRATGGKSLAKAKPKGPTKEELAKQKKLAAAAAAEKKRLDAERKKKAAAAKKAKQAEAKKAAAAKKAKQDAERQRRLAAEQSQKKKQAQAAEKAKQDALKKQLAQAEAEKKRLQALADKKAAAAAAEKAAKAKAALAKAAEAAKAAAKAEPVVKPVAKAAVPSALASASESSAPIATFPLPQDKISNRDRKISGDLTEVCKAIIDNDASVVLHTANKGDYRWMTVRLTLCTRRIDRGFRLRHSFSANSSDEPYLTLHPARSSALVKNGGRF